MKKRMILRRFAALFICLSLICSYFFGYAVALTDEENADNGQSQSADLWEDGEPILNEEMPMAKQDLPTKAETEEIVLQYAQEHDGASYCFDGGTGTKEDPYQIATAQELALLAAMINYQTGIAGYEKGFQDTYFLQTADINLGEYPDWIPIGMGKAESAGVSWSELSEDPYAFQGHYNGAGYTVANMTVDVFSLWEMVYQSDSARYGDFAQHPVSGENGYFAVGLFGRVINDGTSDDAAVSDLVLQGASFQFGDEYWSIETGHIYIGGVAGVVNASVNNLAVVELNMVARNMQTTGVSALRIYGGVVGALEQSQSSVSNCVIMDSTINTDNIDEGEEHLFVGGLVGRAAYMWAQTDQGAATSGACNIVESTVANTNILVTDITDSFCRVDLLVGTFSPDGKTVYAYDRDELTLTNVTLATSNLIVNSTAINKNTDGDEVDELTDDDRSHAYNKLGAGVTDASFESVTQTVSGETVEIPGKYTVSGLIDSPYGYVASNIGQNFRFYWLAENGDTVSSTASFVVDPAPAERTYYLYLKYTKDESNRLNDVLAVSVTIPAFDPQMTLLYFDNDDASTSAYQALLSEEDIPLFQREDPAVFSGLTYAWYFDGALLEEETGDTYARQFTIGRTLKCQISFTYYGEAYTIEQEVVGGFTIYVDQKNGDDANTGRKAEPVKTLAQAFALLEEKNPNGTREQNTIVIIGDYTTDTATTTPYGRRAFETSNLITPVVFPELLQGHTPPYNATTAQITESTDTQAFLKEMAEGSHVNATIRGVMAQDAISGWNGNKSVIQILVDGTGSEDRSILQYSDLTFDEITLKFCRGNNVNSTALVNRRMTWYCNGYDLTMGKGVEISGIRYVSSQINNGILSAPFELKQWKNIPDLSFVATTFTSMPIVAALEKYTYNGEDYYCYAPEKLGNTIHIAGGKYARIMGGGRSGDTFLSTMEVWDEETNAPIKPYRRMWLYGSEVSEERQGDLQYLWDSYILVDGTATAALVTGGQADSIAFVNSHVTIGGNAAVAVAVGGSIGYGVDNNKSAYPNEKNPLTGKTLTTAERRTMLFANDFKGNTQLNIEGDAYLYALYGGSLGRNNTAASYNGGTNATPSCAVRGESVTVNIRGGEISKVYGGGAGATVGTSTAENAYRTTDYIAADVPCDITLNISGGLIKDNVYGGGNGYYEWALQQINPLAGNIYGDVFVNISGGQIMGNVYGGGKGVNLERFAVGSSAYNLYQDREDLAQIYGNCVVTVTGGSFGGDIYGGSFGVRNRSEMAKITGQTNVIISGDAVVPYDVYGGGENGNVVGVAGTEYDGGSHVFISGGTVKGSVYGGGRYGSILPGAADGYRGALVMMIGGTVRGNIYGGCLNADVDGYTKVMILNGEIQGLILGGNNQSGTVQYGAFVYFASRRDGDTVYTPQPKSSTFGAGLGYETTVGTDANENGGTIVRVGDRVNMTKPTDTSSMDSEQASDHIIYSIGEALNAVTDPRFETLTEFGRLLLLLPEEGSNVTYEDNNTFTLYNRIYGGGMLGLVSNTNVLLYGGTLVPNKTLYQSKVVASIFGGGYGGEVSASVSGLNEFYAANAEHTNIIIAESFSFEGNVYGGGELSGVGLDNTAIRQKKEQPVETQTDGASTQVEIRDNAVVNGRVYGAGLGQTGTTYARVFGTAYVRLTDNAQVEDIYGGGYTAAADASKVVINGGIVKAVYGGGRYGNVDSTAVYALTDSEVQGNIYGGCCNSGTVQDAYVNIGGHTLTDETRVHVHGSVFGAGYGLNTVTINTKVEVCMAGSGQAVSYDESGENFTTVGSDDADIIIYEHPESSEYGGMQSGLTNLTYEWVKSDEDGNCHDSSGSYITGDVYGGGDMGKVGIGTIAANQTSATITKAGYTHVAIHNGHIMGSVYGGGSGVPAEGMKRYAAMGAVFGYCDTHIHDGVIEGSVFGGGDQSFVFAADSGDYVGEATNVTLKEPEDERHGSMIVVGGSVYGGGNIVSGSVHASVYTVFGTATVNLEGQREEETNGATNPEPTTLIFLLGGVYGDGNLCLVNGKRTVNITDFHYDDEKYTLLKTFYSVQRADEVNLTRSRIALIGAVDLVDVAATGELYAINRVSQLNLYQSSTVKFSSIVNLLGGLSSDQSTDTLFIDRGNNAKNDYTLRDGAAQATAINNATEYSDTAIQKYLEQYEAFKDTGNVGEDYQSFNVICVANGRCLEIKKDASNYGNVTGLFALELLYAVPGEGGGFVYANIGEKGIDKQFTGSTGDFICCTLKDSSHADKSEVDRNDYMIVEDDCGGFSTGNTAYSESGDYSYYYWYIIGMNYRDEVYLQGYIGSSVTDYAKDMPVAEYTNGSKFVLQEITVSENDSFSMTDAVNVSDLFNSSQFISYWNDEQTDTDRYAIELMAVVNGDADNAVSIGFLSYDGTRTEQPWGIVLDGETQPIYGYGEDVSDETVIDQNRLYTVTDTENTPIKGLQFRFVLHKGTQVYTEIDNVPLTLVVHRFDLDEFTRAYTNTEPVSIDIHLYTTITRLVPRQVTGLIAGRSYISFVDHSLVQITKNSSFTAEVFTDYIPANYNIKDRVFTLNDTHLYLFDSDSGISFTLDENGTLTYASQGTVSDYTVTKSGDDYCISYDRLGKSVVLTPSSAQSAGNRTVLPAGTTITLVATINEGTPSYWYYYCETDTDADGIPLSSFVRMSQDKTSGETFTIAAASAGAVSDDSDFGVTEDLIFVVDFANAAEDWVATEEDSMQVRVEYLYDSIGGFSDVDIMNYVRTVRVPTENSGSQSTVTLQVMHNMPSFGNGMIYVSQSADGLAQDDSSEDVKALSLTLEPPDGDAYDINGSIAASVTVSEDEVYDNTQIRPEYDGRSYSIKLELLQNGVPIQFPMGAVLLYDDLQIGVETDGSALSLPICSAGTHEFVLNMTNSSGLEEGSYTLRASLYSSPVTGYYNDIGPLRTDTVEFTAQAGATHSLQLRGTQRVFSQGDTLTLFAVVRADQVDEEERILVNCYRYLGADQYEQISHMTLFSEGGNHDVLLDSVSPSADTTVQWSAVIDDSDTAGTYRLEFVYHDRTEYWDFIVRD